MKINNLSDKTKIYEYTIQTTKYDLYRFQPLYKLIRMRKGFYKESIKRLHLAFKHFKWSHLKLFLQLQRFKDQTCKDNIIQNIIESIKRIHPAFQQINMESFMIFHLQIAGSGPKSTSFFIFVKSEYSPKTLGEFIPCIVKMTIFLAITMLLTNTTLWFRYFCKVD